MGKSVNNLVQLSEKPTDIYLQHWAHKKYSISFLQKSILCMACNYLLLSIATAVATNDDLEKIGK